MFSVPDTIDESLFRSDNPQYNVAPKDIELLEKVMENCLLRGLEGFSAGGSAMQAQSMSLDSYLKNGGDPEIPVEIHMMYAGTDHIAAQFVWAFNGDDVVGGSNFLISTLESTDPQTWWNKWSQAVRDAYNGAVVAEVTKGL